MSLNLIVSNLAIGKSDRALRIDNLEAQVALDRIYRTKTQKIKKIHITEYYKDEQRGPTINPEVNTCAVSLLLSGPVKVLLVIVV